MKYFAIIVLLALAGCKLDMPANRSELPGVPE